MTELSPLQKARLGFKPVLPATLAAGIKKVAVIEGEKTECVKDQEQIKKLLPIHTANALLPSNLAKNKALQQEISALSYPVVRLPAGTMLLPVCMML